MHNWLWNCWNLFFIFGTVCHVNVIKTGIQYTLYQRTSLIGKNFQEVGGVDQRIVPCCLRYLVDLCLLRSYVWFSMLFAHNVFIPENDINRKLNSLLRFCLVSWLTVLEKSCDRCRQKDWQSVYTGCVI